MSSPAFANLGQPHGALFSDVPTDADVLRRHYGPAAVPSVDPTDEDYTWTEEAAPISPQPPTPVDLQLASLDAGLRALQADVRHLQTIVHRLLNPGCDET